MKLSHHSNTWFRQGLSVLGLKTSSATPPTFQPQTQVSGTTTSLAPPPTAEWVFRSTQINGLITFLAIIHLSKFYQSKLSSSVDNANTISLIFLWSNIGFSLYTVNLVCDRNRFLIFILYAKKVHIYNKSVLLPSFL